MNARFLFSVALLSLLLVACNRHPKPTEPKPPEVSADAKLREKLIGTWRASGGVIEISSDGTGASSFTNLNKITSYRWTWNIVDGFVVSAVTHAKVRNSTNTTAHESVGTQLRLKVISVDTTNLTWEMKNQTVSLKRIK